MTDSSIWALDPSGDFLNHGSFGACPIPVLEAQRRWRDALEANPVRFFLERYPDALAAARAELADFVGADSAGVVFVSNATTGVNAVIRPLETRLGPGDELLVTDHAYNACRNTVDAVAARSGATVVVAAIPFPIGGPNEATEAVLNRAGSHTRLALVDHVTSPTGLILPIAEIVAALEPEVPVLVDGAHAPGMVSLRIEELGASFYAGNCHKWVCAPKGAGMLWVGEAHRDAVEPTVISHGWNDRYPADSRFHALFNWVGTIDPSAWLSVPTALETVADLHPDGWPGVMAANRALALEARALLLEALGDAVPAPAPEEMIGSMASLLLPPSDRVGDGIHDPLMERLAARGFTVPVYAWPAPPQRVLRISAQRYNHIDQYRRLAAALDDELSIRRSGGLQVPRR